MEKLFKIAIFIQSLLTGVYMILALVSKGISNTWLIATSFVLFVVSVFIFGVITQYTNHNDIFKSVKELQDTRREYRIAKQKYLNAMIDKIEK